MAEELGEDINSVFKTLVLHGDRCGYFCLRDSRKHGGGSEDEGRESCR